MFHTIHVYLTKNFNIQLTCKISWPIVAVLETKQACRLVVWIVLKRELQDAPPGDQSGLTREGKACSTMLDYKMMILLHRNVVQPLVNLHWLYSGQQQSHCG